MHPHPDPAFDLIAPATVVTLGYLARVRLKPFKTCRRCGGYGRLPAGIGGRRLKPCKRCGGKGLRPRAFRGSARAARRVVDDARSERNRRPGPISRS